MNREDAQSAVTLSALVVAGVFAYRKLTEPAVGGRVPATSTFVVGFGFTFILLSLVAQAEPQLGGTFAVLVATGDLLANGQPLVKDIQTALNRQAAATRTAPAAAATGGASTSDVPTPGQTSGRGIQLIQPGRPSGAPIQLVPLGGNN